jgi:hypothetical protein
MVHSGEGRPSPFFSLTEQRSWEGLFSGSNSTSAHDHLKQSVTEAPGIEIQSIAHVVERKQPLVILRSDPVYRLIKCLPITFRLNLRVLLDAFYRIF